MHPKSGPLLIMAIRMLQDLGQFLMLASFVLVGFAAAFFVNFNGAIKRAAADGEGAYDASSELSFYAILMKLAEGTMVGEPDRILIDDIEELSGSNSARDVAHRAARSSIFAWCLMALFGICVVLLLLNLLIARFAKTFDMVYENVDANFKVAFARVTLKGAGLQAIPPPFNLLRSLLLAVYALVNHAVVKCRSLTHAERFVPLEDSPAAASGPENYDITTEDVRSIFEFLRKATSPEVQLYPKEVEKWVLQHQFDVSREERWRMDMTQHLGSVNGGIRSLAERLVSIEGTMARLARQQHDMLEHSGLQERHESARARLTRLDRSSSSPSTMYERLIA